MKCAREATVTYTNNDDGIWLACEAHVLSENPEPCWFRKNLGFRPTVAEIVLAEQEHHDRETT